jgi:hypothetical protein
MRRPGAFAIGLKLALWAMPAAGIAQPVASPEPILRTTIDPPRVVVGQQTTLRVEVLAPNYMTAPPVIPEFQIRNAVTRRLPNLNLSERRDGITYAGVRFEFAIYPQEPGSYAVADQKVSLKYAAEPPQTREATLSLPRIQFEAFIPDAAAQLTPFLAASKLTIEQVVQRSSDELKVGDGVTRIVTVKAEGTPAMLLPPVRLSSMEGLAIYPAQSSLQESIDRRTGVLTAARQDSATYMLEQAGDYLLPAIAMRWWNVRSNRIETARADTVALHVLAYPQAPRVPTGAPGSRWSWDAVIGFIGGHWPLLLAGIAAVSALIWLSPRAVPAMVAWHRRQRDAYLASEPWSFACLLASARHRDPGRMYFALMNWLARFGPLAPSHTIAALRAAARNRGLDHHLDALERHLFAAEGGSQGWSAPKLLVAITATRWRLLRQASRIQAAPPLPRDINPVALSRSVARGARPAAR